MILDDAIPILCCLLVRPDTLVDLIVDEIGGSAGRNNVVAPFLALMTVLGDTGRDMLLDCMELLNKSS